MGEQSGRRNLLPVVEQDASGYWEAARLGELRFQQCLACGRFRHYPLPRCPHCRSAAFSWERSGGRGTLYTWTVARHQVHPAFPTPYIIALVEMADCGGARVVCNLDCDPSELSPGAPIEIWFEARGEMAVPQGRVLP